MKIEEGLGSGDTIFRVSKGAKEKELKEERALQEADRVATAKKKASEKATRRAAKKEDAENPKNKTENPKKKSENPKNIASKKIKKRKA